MPEPAAVRVFFEPKISPHDPELYSGPLLDAKLTLAEAASAAGIEAYRQDGFLLVRGLLSEAEILAARTELGAMTLADDPGCDMIWYEGGLRDHIPLDPGADHQVDGRSSGGGFTIGQEGRALPAVEPRLRAAHVRKFMGFIDGHPALAALARHPAVLGLVQRIVGAPPELFQEMALIKPPGGREKPWHQDHAYFNFAIETPIAGVWIPMEAVGPLNGCMYVLRGGHREGPRLHFKRRDWQICDSDVAEARRVALPMAPGDVLLFDGKLPHGTPTNRTDAFRWAVQFHYRPGAAVSVDDDVRLAAFGSEGKNVTC
jgi:phytanoyl-CoA hydroxylase